MQSSCNEINTVNIINQNELKKKTQQTLALLSMFLFLSVLGFWLFSLLSTIWRLFHNSVILNTTQEVPTVGWTLNELKP